MAFAYLTNVPPEQAKREYFRALRDKGFRMQVETVPVQASCGRVSRD